MTEKEVGESLNKISSNLAEINSTLKENKGEKVEKPLNYNEMVQDLIQKIDSEKTLFTFIVFMRVFKMFFIYLVLFMLVVTPTQYSPSVSLADKIVIAFAGLAIIVSLVQIEIPNLNGKAIDAMYKEKAEKFKVSEEEKPILKALIKMKFENMEFTLAEICKITPEMFTKEKLLERLYE
jgi:ABC-type multidrug transport system fused ATPase/permease subunit